LAPKKTIEDARRAAIRRGGECLSNEYLNSWTKLQWKCEKGHRWEATFDGIQAGHWCPECGKENCRTRLRKYTRADMVRLARDHDGEFLSEEFTDTRRKYRWRCKEGHTWEALPFHVIHGHWCPRCAGVGRGSIEEMRELARQKGGECLSNAYRNSTTKLRWRCGEGHEWEALPGPIKRGTWCPVCGIKKRADSRRASIDEIRAIALRRGGDCLSNEYVGPHKLLLWRCSEGHEWKASTANVKAGKWCPTCHSYLGERVCRIAFEDIFGRRFPRAHPNWLLSKDGTRLELDGYCEPLSLAFEHQGRQHYERVAYFQKAEDYSHRQKLDRRKRTLCRDYGVSLVEIPDAIHEIGLDNLTSHIIQKCQELGIPVDERRISRNPPDFDKAYVNAFADALEDLRRLCRLNSGQLLSAKYLGAHTKLEFQCAKGHRWKAKPIKIRNGTWCPFCSGRGTTIEDLRAIARSRDGECLSPSFLGKNKKHRWRCAQGHEWEAIPQSIIRQQSWCPYCFGLNKTIADMQRLAQAKEGECLSKRYVNSHTKLRWRCSQGHEWSAAPTSVVSGHWCPICGHERTSKARRKKGSPVGRCQPPESA